MADSTISGLSAAVAADRTMEVPVNKGGGENAKVTLEQIIDLVSDAISNTLSVAQVRSVTSDELSAVSSQISLEVSARAASIQTLSNAVTSVDTHVNTVSNAVCNEISARALSIQTLSDAVTSVNNRVISILSNEISVLESVVSVQLSQLISAVSNVSANSAAGSATGLQNVVNMLSNKISQINAGAGLTSSQVSDMIGSVNGANYSIRIYDGTSVKGLQSVLNKISDTFSNAFSAGSIMSGNVTSLQAAVASINSIQLSIASAISLVSTVSAAGTAVGLQSVVNAISNRISAMASGVSARSIGTSTRGSQSIIDALSNTISNTYGRVRIITTTVAASVPTALADVLGTTVVVSAGAYYQYDAKLNVAISAANAFKIGMTFPAQTAGAAGGFMMGAGSMVASAWQSTIGNIQIMAFDAAASGSVILSVVKGTVSASPVMIQAQFAPTATGNIVIQYAASVSSSNVKINPGSYVRVFKLVDTGQ